MVLNDPFRDLNGPAMDLKVVVNAVSDPFTDLNDPFKGSKKTSRVRAAALT